MPSLGIEQVSKSKPAGGSGMEAFGVEMLIERAERAVENAERFRASAEKMEMENARLRAECEEWRTQVSSLLASSSRSQGDESWHRPAHKALTTTL